MTWIFFFSILLSAGSVREVTLQPGTADTYELRMRQGQSADVVVRQQGVDVVVEVRDPSGKLIDAVDGPTGRNGDERVEIFASRSGAYQLLVRPFDGNEPAGKYTLEVKVVRTAKETQALLRTRREERDRATEWLRAHSGAIPESGKVPDGVDLRPLDEAARRARVLAIGEATHGSREFGDVRLSLTRRLIERHGYRVVVIEASVTLADSGWIGRRAQRELKEWVRSWNSSHADDRVQIVGVDAQGNAPARASLGTFLKNAYGITTAWEAAEKELAAADEQTAVFGDSSVNAATRQFLLNVRAMLFLDALILRARFGAPAVNDAQHAASILLQFADFNSDSRDAITHSRDWYMAANVLAALEEAGPRSRAVYWAHNAHVAAPPNGRTTGAVLRTALGCDYVALAVTFGSGAFVAQIPNDAEDRLAVSTLPVAEEETIEGVVRQISPGGVLATWPCNVDLASAPAWLRTPHPMHWVGGLYAPGSLPAAAYRSFNLLRDFDGLIYLPAVSAEEIPTDRPRVAPRRAAVPAAVIGPARSPMTAGRDARRLRAGRPFSGRPTTTLALRLAALVRLSLHTA